MKQFPDIICFTIAEYANEYKLRGWIDEKKLVYIHLFLNPNNSVFDTLEQNPYKIFYAIISENPNDGALNILEQNPDKIYWNWLSMNPNDRGYYIIRTKSR